MQALVSLESDTPTIPLDSSFTSVSDTSSSLFFLSKRKAYAYASGMSPIRLSL